MPRPENGRSEWLPLFVPYIPPSSLPPSLVLQLAKVTESLQSKQWTVGQLVSAVLRYAHLDTLGRGQTLFEFLLNQ